jgi:ketol-acid reductoisomerase
MPSGIVLIGRNEVTDQTSFIDLKLEQSATPPMSSLQAPDAPVRQIQPRTPSARKSPRNIKKHGSDFFRTKPLNFLSGPPETVVIGGRAYFPLVAHAFDAAGIKQILIIGWGSQGPAQAQNLRDTLKAIRRDDIKVCVGLRDNSPSISKAKEAGFSEEDGTLGHYLSLAQKSDLVICLMADGGMVSEYKSIFEALKQGAIIGISHGFLAGYLETIGEEFPKNHDVIMVAPKGMGPSVRALYEQGWNKEGAGINSSVAIKARSESRFALVRDVANAWSIAIGSPVTFSTDFISEVISDLFGERSMLLGGLWATAEALFGYYNQRGDDLKTCFELASSGITGTVTNRLSAMGIRGFRENLLRRHVPHFDRGYALGYPVFDRVMDCIYRDVSSLQEIASVIEETQKLKDHPMKNIENVSLMWQTARVRQLYGKEVVMSEDLAFSAGIYVGGQIAQLHTLLQHGHCVSETGNETSIEAWDSLTPYMHARGVGYMVDNCSITARLGTRRWGPVFQTQLARALSKPTPGEKEVTEVMRTFHDGPLHHDLDILMAHRPSVRISVPLN